MDIFLLSKTFINFKDVFFILFNYTSLCFSHQVFVIHLQCHGHHVIIGAIKERVRKNEGLCSCGIKYQQR